MSYKQLNAANQAEVRKYANAWKFGTGGNPSHWRYFAELNDLLYQQLPPKVRQVHGQPYANQKQMADEYEVTGILKVSLDFADEHPIWSEADNVKFRAVHDYHHIKSGGKFTWVGEKLACESHLEALKDRVLSTLFIREVRFKALEAVMNSECLGQTAVAILDEKFPPQYIKEMNV